MNRKNSIILAGGLIILGLILAYTFGVGQPGTKETIQKSERIAEGSVPSAYKTRPPTSGAYYPSTASCKIYDTEIPTPQLVHNLRNGHIVLLYKRSIDSTTWGKIRELEKLTKDGDFLAAPFEDMKTALSVVAWGWHLDLQAYDEGRIMNFYNAHRGEGVENARCSS
jgi:hypothetical protein